MSQVDDGPSHNEPWGSRLKHWREWDKNWTQEDLRENIEAAARRLKLMRGDRIDVTLIRKWERGATKKPQAHYRQILSELGAPLPTANAQPTLALVPEEDGDSRHSPRTAAHIIHQVTQEDLSVNRRELAQLFLNMVAGSALIDVVDRLLTGPAETVSAARRTLHVGYDEVTQIENAARLFRGWDDQFGGGLRRKAVVGQLNEIADLLTESHPPEISRRLNSAMAQLAETAATMSWDSGYGGLAQRYYIMALHAAKTAGDSPFSANILAGMARQALYMGNASDALELVRLAQDFASDRASASVRSMLYTREAWAYAASGRISAFQRATRNAEDTYAEANPSIDPHWIQYFDLAELNGTIGGRFLELAVADARYATPAAARITQAIDSRRPDRLRSSALDELGLAESFFLQGELEEGARLGHIALDRAVQTSSDRVRVQLLGLYQRTAAHGTTLAVKELHDRMVPLCG